MTEIMRNAYYCTCESYSLDQTPSKIAHHLPNFMNKQRMLEPICYNGTLSLPTSSLYQGFYCKAKVHNSKCATSIYGFYTHHLDRMTETVSSEYAYPWTST